MMRRGQPGKSEEATASASTVAVQQNWQDRDFLVSVQLGVSQLSAFLNDFGARLLLRLLTEAMRACATRPVSRPDRPL